MRTLEFDFPELSIGTAEYPDGPTGCTVFVFESGVVSSADVRGGAPGTVFADESGFLHAICFAGGSLMGLEAASGVASEIFAKRGHENVEWTDVPLVGGAIVFDFLRKTGVYPDKALGAAAYRAAKPGVFECGPVGAGRNVWVGKGGPGTQPERSGQGGAFLRLGDVRIAVFTVVNAMGAIVGRDNKVLSGYLASSGERQHLHASLRDAARRAAPPRGNTTLTLVVTNQRMPGRDLRQFARQVHASMARAIQPFHTALDGDVLFAVTTGAVEEPRLADVAYLGTFASEVAWDAVLAAVED